VKIGCLCVSAGCDTWRSLDFSHRDLIHNLNQKCRDSANPKNEKNSPKTFETLCQSIEIYEEL